MRPLTLGYLYIRRLRTHPLQELLAGLGIAIGVALTCAVQIANHSVTGAARETIADFGGSARLQLTARSPHGVDERIVTRVRAVGGVRSATGVLEQRGLVTGQSGVQLAVHLVGAELGPRELGALLRGQLSIANLRLAPGIMLPHAMAKQLGALVDVAGRHPTVELRVRGRSLRLPVIATPDRDRVGSFADGRTAVLPRAQLQRIAGLPGRVTRVLVQPAPGRDSAVSSQLARLGGGRLAVSTPHAELGLLKQATGPADRASTFFTLIAAIVGLLLAFNAMLLSAPERRRMLAELRLQGFRQRQLVQLTLFQSVVLGVVASAVGLLVAQLLAHGVLEESADYLTGAFSFGRETATAPAALVLSFAGGIAAACLAALPPLFELRRRGSSAADYRDSGERDDVLSPSTKRRVGLLAVAALVVSLALARVEPIAAILALALALMAGIPALVGQTVGAARWAGARAGRHTMVVLGLLVTRATTPRSLALAATAALAVFGSVAVGGARHDLLRGIERFTRSYTQSADLWVVHAKDDQATEDFPAGGLARRLARVKGVHAVRAYRGGYLDVAGRRVWVIARDAPPRGPVPADEVIGGEGERIGRRLRAGGWLTVSSKLAEALHTRPGATLMLPLPTGPRRFRVAATTTNFGWSAGAIVLGGADYRRAWGSADPSALELDVVRSAPLARTRAAVQRALGPSSGLSVLTAADRAARADESAREGLARLGQIAALLVVGAALAMAAAMGAALWQRRPTLAALRLQGLRPAQLWTVVVVEGGLVVLAGCLAGAVAGIYGQYLIDRYLKDVTGFAAPFSLAGGLALEALVVLLALALTSIAVPAWLAASTPPQFGLREESA